MEEDLFNTVQSNLTMNNVGETFLNFNEQGNEELLNLRQTVTTPLSKKEPRILGINEAAPMIGRSVPWLRENDTDSPKTPSGRKIYTISRIHELRKKYGTEFVRKEATETIVKATVIFKGGVGKTTTVVHEAYYMATVKGLRVLVIDLDPQATTTFSLGPFIPDLELEREDTIVEPMTEDYKTLGRVIRKSYIPNIDLIPSNLWVQDVDMVLPNPAVNNHKRMGSPLLRLKNIVDIVKHNYDLILFDCPPNMGSLTTNALLAANALTIPIPPARYDLASLVMFSKSLGGLFDSVDKQMSYVRLLITKHPNSDASKRVEANIRKIFGEYVMTNVIVETAEVEKACEQFTCVYDLNKALSDRDTRNRALSSMNAVYEEMFSDYLRIWGMGKK